MIVEYIILVTVVILGIYIFYSISPHGVEPFSNMSKIHKISHQTPKLTDKFKIYSALYDKHLTYNNTHGFVIAKKCDDDDQTCLWQYDELQRLVPVSDTTKCMTSYGPSEQGAYLHIDDKMKLSTCKIPHKYVINDGTISEHGNLDGGLISIADHIFYQNRPQKAFIWKKTTSNQQLGQRWIIEVKDPKA